MYQETNRSLLSLSLSLPPSGVAHAAGSAGSQREAVFEETRKKRACFFEETPLRVEKVWRKCGAVFLGGDFSAAISALLGGERGSSPNRAKAEPFRRRVSRRLSLSQRREPRFEVRANQTEGRANRAKAFGLFGAAFRSGLGVCEAAVLFRGLGRRFARRRG